MEFIAKNHPVDPVTNDKFMVWERITVENYYTKLLDPCGCQRI
jgi:hypothetical protein